MSGKRPDWAPEGFGWFGPDEDAPVSAAEALTMALAELEDIGEVCDRWTLAKQKGPLFEHIRGCKERARIVIEHVRSAHLEAELRVQSTDGGA